MRLKSFLAILVLFKTGIPNWQWREKCLSLPYLKNRFHVIHCEAKEKKNYLRFLHPALFRFVHFLMSTEWILPEFFCWFLRRCAWCVIVPQRSNCEDQSAFKLETEKLTGKPSPGRTVSLSPCHFAEGAIHRTFVKLPNDSFQKNVIKRQHIIEK